MNRQTILRLAEDSLTLWGNLWKEEEVEARATPDDENVTALPSVPAEDPPEIRSKEQSLEALEQVSRLLHQVLADPKLARQLEDGEIKRLQMVEEWLRQGMGEPLRLAKQLGGDIKLSVKAIIKGPKGELVDPWASATLMLKDAYGPWWDLPGGHVQEGETLVEALRREVKEETDLDLLVIREREVRMLKLGDELKPVVFYDAVASGPLTLSEEHTSYRFFDDRELGEIDLGVFRDVLVPQAVDKAVLLPSGDDVSVLRPSHETVGSSQVLLDDGVEKSDPRTRIVEEKGMGTGDDLTNPRLQASLDEEEDLDKAERATQDLFLSAGVKIIRRGNPPAHNRTDPLLGKNPGLLGQETLLGNNPSDAPEMKSDLSPHTEGAAAVPDPVPEWENVDWQTEEVRKLLEGVNEQASLRKRGGGPPGSVPFHKQPPRPGLVPESGDPEHPYRWVRPDQEKPGEGGEAFAERDPAAEGEAAARAETARHGSVEAYLDVSLEASEDGRVVVPPEITRAAEEARDRVQAHLSSEYPDIKDKINNLVGGYSSGDATVSSRLEGWIKAEKEGTLTPEKAELLEAVRSVAREAFGSEPRRLYRGVMDADSMFEGDLPKKGEQVQFPAFGLSSWTTDPKVATEFARGVGGGGFWPQSAGLLVSRETSLDEVLMAPFLHDDPDAVMFDYQKEFVLANLSGQFDVSVDEVY